MYNYTKKYIIGLFLFIISLVSINSSFAVRDIMDVMFQPAKGYEKIVDLGSTKNAVGNEVFKESTQISAIQGGCVVNGQIIEDNSLEIQKNQVGYQGSNEDFCSNVLGGINGDNFDWSDFDFDGSNFDSEKQAPLIVRITKFLLRITIVLSITMILYNGILRVVESAKGGDVKDAKNNIIYIVGGILLALSSVALINIISSLTLSSLNPDDMPSINNESIIN